MRHDKIPMGHGYHGPSALCNVGRRSLTPALPPRPESEYPKERRSSDAAAVWLGLDHEGGLYSSSFISNDLPKIL